MRKTTRFMRQMFVFVCVWAVIILSFYIMLIDSFTTQCNYRKNNRETKNSAAQTQKHANI